MNPLVAIIGMVVGTMVSGVPGFPAVGPGFGLVLAALGNWGLWQLIYPKQPRVLIDSKSMGETHGNTDAAKIAAAEYASSMRSYRSDDTMYALARVAWTAAKKSCEKLDPDHKKSLMVGLRGVTSFGSILKGSTVGEAEPEAVANLHDTAIFYPAFVPAKES